VLVSVVYRLSYVLVIINWLSHARYSGRLSVVISYFLQMYHMLLHIIHVRQILHLLSCTRRYCRRCVQIFLQVCCVPDIFAGDIIYTGSCRRFRLTYRLILREKELHFNIGVYNPSKELTFSFNLLLHTYFKVPDVRRCQITGLHGCTFIDKVTQSILHCGC